MGFVDSYTMTIALEENGIAWNEHHNDISLSDFETIYGNITANIVFLKLVINS